MESRQPLISVIVPVYKTEKYLRQCVVKAADFALDTYSNMEVGHFLAERAADCKKTVYGFLRENLYSKKLKPERKWMMRTTLKLPFLYRQLCRTAARAGRK